MKLMNLSELMDRAIDILRKNIKSLALFSLGYVVITFIAIIIASIILAIIGGITFAISRSVVLSTIMVSILILIIAAFIFSYNIGIIKISSEEFTKEQVFAHTAIKASFKSIFKVFGIILIAFIALIPVIAAFGWLGYLLVKEYNITNININMFKGIGITIIILSFIYIIAAIFAVLAILTWFSFSLHALAIEKISIIKSIKKSFYLVRKEYWRVFGATMLFTLTVAVLRLSVDLILSTASSAIYLILKLLSFKQDYFTFLNMVYSYANWPLSILLMMVITPIGTIMLTMLYFNQRFKKEGYDLELRLREIELKNERKQLSEIN